jgi:hypothetical protein
MPYSVPWYRRTLTAQTLQAVTCGPLVQKLGLSSDDENCTRNEFILLFLFLQGKLSAGDIRTCREAFDALDLTGDGVLTQKDLKLSQVRQWEEVVQRLRRDVL